MKKLMTFLACAILSMGVAIAQNTKTYSGFVVDKNGNPVVGAEVVAPGGGASVITDSDGSFQIEVPFMLNKLTASYTGMRQKTLKLKDSDNLVFRMKALKKRTGFMSLVGGLGVVFETNEGYGSGYSNDDETYGIYGVGIMGGQISQLSNWGWYGKGMIDIDNYYYIATVTITAGAIRRLGGKTHLYFGGGLAILEEDKGFSVDLGTIFTVSNNVNVVAGLNFTGIYEDHYSHYEQIKLNIGVGYTF